jgi:ribonuclease P protein component
MLGSFSPAPSAVSLPTGMDRQSRLRKNEDFQRVRRDGRSWATPLVVLIAARNDLDRTRFGFAVGKRIGKAVARNRVKRRLREAVRLQRRSVARGWDLVFIAREPLRLATFEDIERAVTHLLRRANVVQVPQEERDHDRPGSRPD